jgi:hypothetical protein
MKKKDVKPVVEAIATALGRALVNGEDQRTNAGRRHQTHCQAATIPTLKLRHNTNQQGGGSGGVNAGKGPLPFWRRGVNGRWSGD